MSMMSIDERFALVPILGFVFVVIAKHFGHFAVETVDFHAIVSDSPTVSAVVVRQAEMPTHELP